MSHNGQSFVPEAAPAPAGRWAVYVLWYSPAVAHFSPVLEMPRSYRSIPAAAIRSAPVLQWRIDRGRDEDAPAR
jgi:hypothetical protein